MPELGVCPDCLEQHGLCGYHAQHVLPQLAINWGWLMLMGEARTEQTTRQSTPALSISPEAQAHRERKRQAKRPKRGIKALARAIFTPTAKAA